MEGGLQRGRLSELYVNTVKRGSARLSTGRARSCTDDGGGMDFLHFTVCNKKVRREES